MVATLFFALIPALNFYTGGWERPLLLTGVMRLCFAAAAIGTVAALYRPLLSRRGLRTTARAMRGEGTLLGLAALTTWDVALFSLAYRFVDISVVTAMTALAPTANVVMLSLINKNLINRRQMAGLSVSALGMILMMWSGGASVEVSGQWWRFVVGAGLGLGMLACNGLTVAALRIGEVLAVEWYWDGLGRGADLVWGGSMLTLALAQGLTAPVFLLLALNSGSAPPPGTLALMALMGFVVFLGTASWALANGSGLRPMVNALGNLQPGWAVLILAVLGISGDVVWGTLMAGLALTIGANIVVQLRGGQGG